MGAEEDKEFNFYMVRFTGSSRKRKTVTHVYLNHESLGQFGGMSLEFDSQASFESNSQLKMSVAPTFTTVK